MVCLGFTVAGILIGKSYLEWQENPITTSITTQPINDLDFPNVTICPPKDSSTALYHDLVKAGNGSLSHENRKKLKGAAFDIFIVETHQEYVKNMLPTLHMGNIDQVLQGFHSLPTPFNNGNGLQIKMWNLNGTITTPWFGGDFVEEYYQEDREFTMVLELPDDIQIQVGSGSLVLELEVNIREEPNWIEEIHLLPNPTLHSDTLKGEKTISVLYSKDQLNFPNFVVQYKYKFASQQLLDSWKDRKMTGFKFSWKIENPPLVANIVELGRSIQTPQLGDPSDESLNRVYKAILTPSKDVLEQIENETLVFELDINMKPSDEVNVFANYKLYREQKSWTDADLQCKSEGGQLATIHSLWEQTLAEKAAEGWKVWLGARKIVGGQWQWADNSPLDFSNWNTGPGANDNLDLLMQENGKWDNLWRDVYDIYFLCQGTTADPTKNGLTSIEFRKDQLAFLPFHIIFKSQGAEPDKPTTNTLSGGGKEDISGFTLNWFLKDINSTRLTEKLPARQEDWRHEVPTPKYKEPLLHDMILLAKELHLQSKKEILTGMIHQKSQIFLKLSGQAFDQVCLVGQVSSEFREDVFSKITPKTNKGNTHDGHSEKDIETGYQLFHAGIFCPTLNLKMYKFIDQLISDETSRTIIQTIVHHFHNRVIDDEKIFALTKSFYFVLASTLNLQYGNVLLLTSTKVQLEEVIQKGLPFFTNHTNLVEKCLQETKCDVIQDIYEKLSKLYIHDVNYILCCTSISQTSHKNWLCRSTPFT